MEVCMKISVAMCTYNGETYIVEQLKSIINQTKQVDEIIICDDCSSDQTTTLVENVLSNTSINYKLIKNENNMGFKKNFYKVLSLCTGDIIFLCDQDDVWMPNKVSSCLKVLKDCDLVLHDAYIVDVKLQIISDSLFEVRKSHKGFINNLYKNSYVGCCMAFRRNIMLKVLPFPSNIAMHDMWIGLNAELYGKTGFILDKLILYRRHENNVSITIGISDKNIYQKITYRLYLLVCILRRLFSSFFSLKCFL